jgi:hypothetical protein
MYKLWYYPVYPMRKPFFAHPLCHANSLNQAHFMQIPFPDRHIKESGPTVSVNLRPHDVYFLLHFF